MAKRFPLTEFEYEELKAHAWTAPEPIAADDAARRVQAAAAGDAHAYGAWVVHADDATFDALDVRGPHRTAVLCVLPAGAVTMLGRSHAWKRQRVAVLDGIPRPGAPVLADWKTPRPMNTRLGPEAGIAAPARVLSLISAHRFADHWIGNRTLCDNEWRPGSGNGFRVLWCDDEDLNDFHAAVVSFAWD